VPETSPAPGHPRWAPDITVDAPLAARVIAEQFHELAGLPVVQIGAGWDNAVFSVGQDWVFRFIYRQTAVEGSAAEVAVLRALPQDLPLPVPRPLFIGTPTDELPWPFWGGPLLPGVEIAEAGVPDDARGAVADAVGRFLRRLHDPELARATTPAARAAGVELRVDPWSRATPREIAPRARETLGRLSALGAWAPDPKVLALLDRAESVGPPSAEPVLVHGDLHIRHVLIADGRTAPRASGVIDWGDTGLGDPAMDLAIGFMAFTGPARRAFLDAYGPADDERLLRARTLAVHLSAALAEQAVGDGMADVTAESLAALGRTAHGTPAVGSAPDVADR